MLCRRKHFLKLTTDGDIDHSGENVAPSIRMIDQDPLISCTGVVGKGNNVLDFVLYGAIVF